MEMLNEINDIGIAQHFNLSEFACPCCKRVMLHPRLLKKLIELRGIVERPVYITSGYRCPEYNQKIGGVVNSYHLIGLAADIRVKDINLIELLEVCEGIGFAGIGLYEQKNFLHLDVRPNTITTLNQQNREYYSLRFSEVQKELSGMKVELGKIE